MTDSRPRSLLGRLISLVRGGFAGWVKDQERRSPKAVYEQAIEERTRHYSELKRAVAGILYMRNKLEGEITELQNEMAEVVEDSQRAVRRGDDEAALTLITHKQRLREDLERAQGELEKIRAEAEDAKRNLVQFRDEIRRLEKEKLHVLASLANARARRRIRSALEGLSLEGEMRALEGVRAYVARVQAEGVLDREVEDDGVATRIRALRSESRKEAARQELAELKRRLPSQTLPARSGNRRAGAAQWSVVAEG